MIWLPQNTRMLRSQADSLYCRNRKHMHRFNMNITTESRCLFWSFLCTLFLDNFSFACFKTTYWAKAGLPSHHFFFSMKHRFYRTYLESASSQCWNLLLFPEKNIFLIILWCWIARLLLNSFINLPQILIWGSSCAATEIHGTTLIDGHCWLPRNILYI